MRCTRVSSSPRPSDEPAPGEVGATVNPDTWGLRPLVDDDVDAVHAIYSDPDTWSHRPDGRFERVEQSRARVREVVAAWRAEGLGPWAVLVRDELVGVGGVTPMTRWWNLGVRLSPDVWGHGLATWVVEVALGAAHRTHADWPVVARSLSTNPASVRVSENAGLALAHVEPWPDGISRVVHADRPVDRDLVRSVLTLD